MGKLSFGMMVSLDGYINDRDGRFDWGQVSEEVHRFAEAQQADETVTIYGRRMFETMAIWDTVHEDQTVSEVERDFSVIWRRTRKIVVSASLDRVSTSNTTLVRSLSPEDVRTLKEETQGSISVAGPTIGSSMLRQGLVDEVSLYIIPVIAGGGTAMFQDIGDLVKLDRLEHRGFENGLVFVRYAVRN